MKISEGFAGLVKIQESSWQYLIENFVAQKFDLKGKITEKEPKSLKEIKKPARFANACTTPSVGQLLKTFMDIYTH